MKRLAYFAVSLLVLLGLCRTPARADYLVGWSYDGNGTDAGVNAPLDAGNGVPAWVSFTGSSRATTAGSQRVPLASVTVDAGWWGQASFGPPDNAVSLALRITDSASGQSGTVTFAGSVSGTVTALLGDLMPGDHPVVFNNLTFTVTSPVPPPLVLGANTYAVTFAGVDFGHGGAGFGDPDAESGAAYADVGVIHNAPEPSAAVLGCAGAACLVALASGRLRARRRPAS
jgi:hypothetical protein